MDIILTDVKLLSLSCLTNGLESGAWYLHGYHLSDVFVISQLLVGWRHTKLSAPLATVTGEKATLLLETLTS